VIDAEDIKDGAIIWGAGLSTLLAAVKLWEAFWKDRLRLETTHSFDGRPEEPDEITIVNLSSVPVQVAYWSLVWAPRFMRWRTLPIDATPEEGAGRFTISPKDCHTLRFAGEDKFDWSYRSASHRQLLLTLHIFGRRRPKVLKVSSGQ
jgi:hypothetical protein